MAQDPSPNAPQAKHDAPRASIVRRSKDRLREQRARIAQLHENEQDGFQTSAAICDLFYAILLDCWDGVIGEMKAEFPAATARVTLVPTGGLGRRDVAPYSDLDVMILHEPGDEERVSELSGRLLRDVFDAGLHLSLAVRTVNQACSLAAKDAEILSSQIDARFLAGSISQFQEFLTAFRGRVRRRWKAARQMILEARDAERRRYGETVYLLEPDVKRSGGTLRDTQLLRWVAGVCHGTPEPRELVNLGLLSDAAATSLRESTGYLLGIRHDMHFHAGSAHDVLDRAEQIRLAAQRGVSGTDGLLPVEEFMRNYFFHTGRIGRIVTRFVDSTEPGPKTSNVLSRLFRQQFGGDYQIRSRYVLATRRGKSKLEGNLAEVVRLAGIAAAYDRRIAHETATIARATVKAAPHAALDEETTAAFVSLLNQTEELGRALRMLHEIRALETIIPPMRHARGLLQFNAYHKYTVDEHCLRAVEAAADFQTDQGQLGRTYRALPRKHVLHLALLLHDLGKGYGKDHSKVGGWLASETARRLSFSPVDEEALTFLVHKHLLMSHMAFRRDSSDPQQVLQFAFDVGSPDLLQMLYVLTAADFQAVGPGVFNDWKADVLTSLYRKAMAHLTGESATPIEQLREARSALRTAFADEAPDLWLDRQIDGLPSSYLYARSPEEIAADLLRLRKLSPGEFFVQGAIRAESRTLEFSVGVRAPQPGNALSRLAGAFSGRGIQIHSVNAYSLADEHVIYRFLLDDSEADDDAARARAEELESVLRAALNAAEPGRGAARRVWQTAAAQRAAALRARPVQVRADNDTLADRTILDVFAPDQLALFYRVAQTLESLDLHVSQAKMSAYLDQALGVFYVTDNSGRKIEDAYQLQAIRTRLVSRLKDGDDSEKPAAPPPGEPAS